MIMMGGRWLWWEDDDYDGRTMIMMGGRWLWCEDDDYDGRTMLMMAGGWLWWEDDDYDGRTERNVNEDIGGRIEAPGKGSISVNMHNHVNPSNTMHVWLACMIRTQYAHICSMHAHNTYTHTHSNVNSSNTMHTYYVHTPCAHNMHTWYIWTPEPITQHQGAVLYNCTICRVWYM